MAGSGGKDEVPLEFTPTWVVAGVCTVIIFVSLFFERLLHLLGKILKKRKQNSLFEALLKVKEELMLLGFISLLLTVLQDLIQKICIPTSLTRHMLPCKKEGKAFVSPSHYQVNFFSGVPGSGRRLLAAAGGSDHCANKGMVPLLSLKALHHLHIFIFALAVSHVSFCAITMLLGMARIQQWSHWEDEIRRKVKERNEAAQRITPVEQLEFAQQRYKGFGKKFSILSWADSFIKQFYGSVTKSDYATLRHGFIKANCGGNTKFDFHSYMIRVLESDFKKVVGISWYLWIFLLVFLLLNVDGWHVYFWFGFLPLILLLAIWTKLEHVICQMAHEVAERHAVVEGDVFPVKPSNGLFWFKRPEALLFLIHFILFQNAFEVAIFFWTWATFGFNSCLMGHVWYTIPRLVIVVIIQVLSCYSTLPLYALVTQMGTTFKKEVFNEQMQQQILGWSEKTKKRKGRGSSHEGERAADPLQEIKGGERDAVPLQEIKGGERDADPLQEIKEGEPNAAGDSAV